MQCVCRPIAWSMYRKYLNTHNLIQLLYYGPLRIDGKNFEINKTDGKLCRKFVTGKINKNKRGNQKLKKIKKNKNEKKEM